jgi:signal-transduction protein with cAMP-binding, CBS, and nucleotidyltransferase domain
MNMSVGDFCTREVVIVNRESSIEQLAQVMRQFHVGDVVVVEERAGERIPVGIVTDRDIVIEVVAKGLALNTVTAGDIMSYDLLLVREQEGLWDVLGRMRSRGVRRVPVVNERGALVGLITLDDLLDLLSEELGALAKLVRREQAQEASGRP